MTSGTDDGALPSLSREWDHLGNLRRELAELSSVATLAYELIQNADDAQATALRFEVGPDALTVWNDSEFSSCAHLESTTCPWLDEQGHRCDFHSFRRIGSGDKQNRRDTTGAFGIGFTSVYRITDHPELISSGEHWLLDEAAEPNDRIQRQRAPQGHTGTTFRLPWAFDGDSTFRVAVNQPALALSDPASLGDELVSVIPDAMLFLRSLERIEVVSFDRTASFERHLEGKRVTLRGPDSTCHEWHLLEGNFDVAASELRRRFGDFIDEYRSSSVTVAVSPTLEGPGLLYVTLPTDEPTHLAVHVDAGFYPKSDRKSVHLERTPAATVIHQVEWNRAALAAAATVLADGLEHLRDVVGFDAVWRTIVEARSLKESVDAGELDPAFGCFWTALCLQVPTAEIVPTAGGLVVAPTDVLLLREEDEVASSQALEAIGINVVEPSLRARCYQARGEATGLRELNLARFCDALDGLGLSEGKDPSEIPSQLSEDGILEGLLAEAALLFSRADAGAEQRKRFSAIAMAPSLDGWLEQWTEIRTVDSASLALLEGVLEGKVGFIDSERVRDAGAASLLALVPPFAVADLVDALEQREALELAEALDHATPSPQSLLGWCADRPAESREVAQRLAALPLFPSATGLHPLADLVVPGDFDDPLGLAMVADAEQVGGLFPFLAQLGAETLTFDTYVRQSIPEYFSAGQPAAARTRQLVRILAQRIGDLHAQPDRIEVLRKQPLVECLDGEFRMPDDVFVLNEITSAVLADGVPYAEEPADGAIKELYRSLGVHEYPSPEAVMCRCRALAKDGASEASKRAVVAILDYLSDVMRRDPEVDLSPVGEFAWLPKEGDTESWHQPPALDLAFVRHLFESTGQFLDLPLRVQQRNSAVLEALGCKRAPKVGVVVEHLIASADHGHPVNRDVYRFLNDQTADTSLDRLLTTSCLLLDDGRYVAPSDVYWSDHGFGRFRVTLDEDFLKYQALLNRLGVKQHPDPLDAVSVLQDVSGESRRSGALLDEDDTAVVLGCWRSLSAGLEDGVVDESELSPLRELAAIPNREGKLQPPANVLFDNWPGLAVQFDDRLARDFITRTSGAWHAMSVVGVRTLTEAVETEIVEVEDAEEDDGTRTRIAGRLRHLERVIEMHGSEARLALDAFMKGLEVVRCRKVLIRRLVELRGRPFPTEVHAVDAVLVGGVLSHRAPRGRVQWSSIAREVERAILPESEPGALSPTIRTILAEPDEESLDQELDQLGIPRIQVVDAEAPASAKAGGFGGSDVIPEGELFDDESDSSEDLDESGGGDAEATEDSGDEEESGAFQDAGSASSRGRRRGDEPEPESDDEAVGGGQDAGDADQTERGDSEEGGSSTGGRSRSRPRQGAGVARKAKRTGGQFVGKSFVKPGTGDDADEDADDEDVTRARTETERAAVDAAIAYEIAAGRSPKEMPPGNPGYDIESGRPGGPIERYIEVKGLSVTWGHDAVQLTPREHLEASDRRDLYWIYVVDDAKQPDLAVLHAIQDPVSKISRYVFDDGWRDAASDEWQPLPDLPVVELRSEPAESLIPFHDLTAGSLESDAAPSGYVEVDGYDHDPDWFAVQLLDRSAGSECFGAVALVEPIGEGENFEGELILLDLRSVARPLPCHVVTVARWWEDEDGDGERTVNLDLGPLGRESFRADEAASLGIIGFVHIPGHEP